LSAGRKRPRLNRSNAGIVLNKTSEIVLTDDDFITPKSKGHVVDLTNAPVKNNAAKCIFFNENDEEEGSNENTQETDSEEIEYRMDLLRRGDEM